MILVTGDLHLSANRRDAYRWEFLKWLRRQVREHEVQAVVVLGDLTEVKDNHPAELVNRIVDEFCKITLECPLIFVRGNHDWLNDPDCPFFAFLDRLDGVIWVNDPTDGEEIPELNSFLRGRTILLPHSTDPVKDWAELKLEDYDLAFCHQTFKGTRSEAGQELDGAPNVLFSTSTLVISGDIHKPQKLGNVIYAGAPYTVDFGDEYEGRVLLLDENKKLKSVYYDGPQKWLREITSIKELEADKDLLKGDILKVRYKLKPEQKDDWPGIQREIREWGKDSGVIVHTTQPILPDTSRKRRKQLTKNVRSDKQLLDDFCARYGVDKQIKKVGHALLSS